MVVTLGQQYNVGGPTDILYTSYYIDRHGEPPNIPQHSKNNSTIEPYKLYLVFNKKNLNASRPSEHPLVRGKNVKTFRWDHRLQIQNLFMAFKRVLRW